MMSYNKTIDVSTLGPNDSLIVYNNGTHNYTTITSVIYTGSKTIPAGQQIGAEGGMNVLGLVMFSIVFGIVLGRMGDKGNPLKAFFETLNEVVMRMVSLVMWYVFSNFISIENKGRIRATAKDSKTKALGLRLVLKTRSFDYAVLAF